MKKLTLGSCADLLLQLRQKKQAAEAVVVKIKEEVSVAEGHMYELLEKGHTKTARGDVANVSITSSLVPTVRDWDAVYTYIIKKKDPGILERRMATTAWRERLESRIVVPGVDPFERVSLHVTSVKEKP